MKLLTRFVVFTITLFMSVFAFAQQSDTLKDIDWPASVESVLSVQPFEVSQSFNLDMRAEKNSVTSGFIIVVKVDPRLVAPTNAAEPILYVGNQPLQKLNTGRESGVIVGLIDEAIDLDELFMWFGEPGLPEQINSNTMENQRKSASTVASLNVGPIRSMMGSKLQASSLQELLRTDIAELVLQHAPEDKELVEAWRLPIISPTTK